MSVVTDEHGVEWMEYCSDDVGECDIRGELTKDATIWINADGSRNKPIIFFEQGDMRPTSFAGRADFKSVFLHDRLLCIDQSIYNSGYFF